MNDASVVLLTFGLGLLPRLKAKFWLQGLLAALGPALSVWTPWGGLLAVGLAGWACWQRRELQDFLIAAVLVGACAGRFWASIWPLAVGFAAGEIIRLAFSERNVVLIGLVAGLDCLALGVILTTSGLPLLLGCALLVGVGGLMTYIHQYLFHANDAEVARSLDQIMASYVKELDDLYARVRGWRHDYHDHLQVLKVQLAHGDTEASRHYLNQLEDKLDEIDTVVHSGNAMLDAVINSKLTIALNADIPIDVSAFVGNQPLIDDVDMVVIIGNILDNAIEAVMEQPKSEMRSMRVYIAIIKQQFYISVTNSRRADQQIDPEYASTKNDRRGLGIRRVNALVAKYHGVINRQYEDGVFATEVLLPLRNVTKAK